MEPFNLPALASRIPDEASAYQFLEELRWDGKPVCPHCGSVGEHYFLTAKGQGRKTRTGKVSQRRVWCCRDCRKQFSVLTGTIMHGTKIPVRTWVFVTYEMCASKNGVSSRELERKYGLTPKSAWFMAHRIRAAMEDGSGAPFVGRVVADETWIGGAPKNRHGARRGQRPKGQTDKTPVLSLVSRETGEVRSRVVPNVRGASLRQAISEHVDLPRTVLHTDSSSNYNLVAPLAAGRESVDHFSYEFVRGDVSTNQAENYFSQLKRSIDGTHHQVSVQHLNRYLAEFDYRYSTRKMSDAQRVGRLMGQMAGRRLTYR